MIWRPPSYHHVFLDNPWASSGRWPAHRIPDCSLELWNIHSVGACRQNMPTPGHLPDRAGRVRELTRPSRSKFKMVWHQFGTAQFSSHQFVWKVCSAQFRHGNQVPPFSSVQARFSASSLQLFGRSRETVRGVPSSRNPSPPVRGLSPGWRDGVLCWLCLLPRPRCGVVSE